MRVWMSAILTAETTSPVPGGGTAAVTTRRHLSGHCRERVGETDELVAPLDGNGRSTPGQHRDSDGERRARVWIYRFRHAIACRGGPLPTPRAAGLLPSRGAGPAPRQLDKGASPGRRP